MPRVLMDMVSRMNPLFEKHIQAQIFNLKSSTSMRNLNPSDIEKMVSLKGLSDAVRSSSKLEKQCSDAYIYKVFDLKNVEHAKAVQRLNGKLQITGCNVKNQSQGRGSGRRLNQSQGRGSGRRLVIPEQDSDSRNRRPSSSSTEEEEGLRIPVSEERCVEVKSLISMMEKDDHVGRILTGRITPGVVRINDRVHGLRDSDSGVLKIEEEKTRTEYGRNAS
ncbi:hypothetical protein L2E82_37231 [Cichorium intybus]|uniref:Uncharacterized protein n=1 Tax=Cichorium intybus TaxID=13427 RepID=A0ACB9AD57_CICIN|nr:hypothetical protein L2E82_37231 [Cichorium intybus]